MIELPRAVKIRFGCGGNARRAENIEAGKCSYEVEEGMPYHSGCGDLFQKRSYPLASLDSLGLARRPPLYLNSSQNEATNALRV